MSYEFYQEFPDFRENVEKIFNSEIRDKKQTGRGIFSRAATRSKKPQTVTLPSERLKGLERKVVMAPGALKIYTIQEAKAMDMMERIQKGEIPSLEEIEELGFDGAQRCIAELRRLHINVDIQRAWKMKDNNKYQGYMSKYMVAKAMNGQVLVGQAAIEYVKRMKASNAKKGNHNGRRGKNSEADLEKDAKKIYDAVFNKPKEPVSAPPESTPPEPEEKATATANIPVTYSYNTATYNPTYSYQTQTPVPIVTYQPQTSNSTPVVPQPWVEEDRNIISINRKYTCSKLVAYLERLGMYLDPDSEFEVEIKIKEIKEVVEDKDEQEES